MKKSLLAIIVILLIVITVGWWLTGKTLNSYLSLHRPIDSADILLVEGWLSKRELETVVRTFNKENYKLIVTSGTSDSKEYQVGRRGSLDFYINPPVLSNDTDILNVTLRGTLPKPYPAIFELYINDNIFSVDSVYSKVKCYSYKVPVNEIINKISIFFVNDAIIDGEDLNLMISSIAINNHMYSAFDTNVFYQVNTRDDSTLFRSARCKADEAAYYIEQYGIKKDKIINICTDDIGISRTLSTACNTMTQLNSIYNQTNHRINIVSVSPHSRRTFMSYSITSNKWNIGIISLNSETDNKYSRIKNIQELTGILVVLFHKSCN